MRRRKSALVAACVAALRVLAAGATHEAGATPADVVHTRHNLSVTGPGQVRALTETRVCVFCHTPHNATPLSPLWNRDLEPQVYTVYASPTSRLGPLPQPSGATKLCLSCHDGTIAMGAVVNPAGGITMEGGGMLPADSLSNFGLDLSGHHPVSFSYQQALPNPDLVPAPPADLTFGGIDELHCTTCHDPHNDAFGRFLAKDNRYAALCTGCHQINGWTQSVHANSSASVVGVLPRPPKAWPTYTQMNEWGCEVCHTPHFAPTAPGLLNFTTTGIEPFTCTSAGCHSSEPASPQQGAAGAPAMRAQRLLATGGGFLADIATQIRKPSAHHQIPGVALLPSRSPGWASAGSMRTVTCVDCHEPHVLNATTAEPPNASGMIAGVTGVDRNGVEISSVRYEYEVCFKCHADNTPDFSFVPRVVDNTNTRLDFDPNNSSYHPVIAIGKNPNIPSIPSSLAPALNVFDSIYCSSCHADDNGVSNGPHGSSFAPILRERYETSDGTPENFDNYALCYRCHERDSILADESFQKSGLDGGGHSGHLGHNAPCSACHDPHGVIDFGAGAVQNSGDHTNLINFDTRIVQARAGAEHPLFEDTGLFAGRCNLVCHGEDHDNASYP